MLFSSRQFADVVVAAPVGRIDHAAAGEFERALKPLLPRAGCGTNALLLDFAGVDYISSVGLRVLMIAAKEARAQGTRIAVGAPQAVVAEILAISRFDSVVELFPSVRGALEKLSTAALTAFDAT